jgi:flagellar hook-associated protein 1 FlgK
LAKEVTQGEPSDLLDQRERLLHRLSEKVITRTNEQEDGSLNVFIGNGQTLVLGKRNAELDLQANEHDPSVLEVIYKSQGTNATVTQFMKGGSVGGLLDFREKMLDGAQNELGRIAIGVSKTFNDQHRKGMTLENELGGDFFKAIDKSTPLTLPSYNNKGNYELKTTVTNVDNLTVSDYTLNYNAGIYSLVKNSDETVVAKFDSLPQVVESEGFTINLERGTAIENGDSFLIRPTHSAARNFSVEIKRTNDIAAASPVRVRTSVHNLGNAKPIISNVSNINSPSFTTAKGMLSPTITVRFIDKNHIELLDDNGKIIQAQQLDAQNKAIPATPAIPGETGSPATPAIRATAASQGRKEQKDNDDVPVPAQIETGIFYDPKVGINLFPTPGGYESGYAVQFSGEAKAGDTFVLEYNADAVGNNVNALELGDLQHKATLANGTSNYGEVYGQLVSRVGSKTHELDVNREAQNILYKHAIAQREAVSGVNLDEEAANLVRYQQAYQANAQVIGAASEMFDTLINVLRR